MSICEATDTYCLGLLVTSPLVFKARVGSLIRTLAEAYDVHALRFISAITLLPVLNVVRF